MLLAGFVVQQRFFGNALRKRFGRYRDRAVRLVAVQHNHFECGKRAARVAVGKIRDRLQHIGRNVDFLSAKAARVSERAGEQGSKIVRTQRLQNEHLAAG